MSTKKVILLLFFVVLSHTTYSQNNSNFLNKIDITQGDAWQKHDVLLEYTANKEDFNLNHKTMDEILLSDWFNIDLPKSWESYETLPTPCWTFCDGFQKDNETE